MDFAERKEKGELMPYWAWKGRFGSGPENEDPDGGSLGAEAFDIWA